MDYLAEHVRVVNVHIEEAAKLKEVEVLLIVETKHVSHTHVATDYKVEDQDVSAGREVEVDHDED